MDALPVWTWPGAVPVVPPHGVFVISVATDGGTLREPARAQLRQALMEALSAVLKVPGAAISLRSTPGQAPGIVIAASSNNEAIPRHIACSFSHESGLSLAAVNLHGAIGIDIMRVVDTPDWQAVSHDYLGPDVTATLLALPAVDRPRAFAQAWTANEARLKCLGRQLSEWQPSTNGGALRCLALDLPGGFTGALVTSA